MTRSEDSSCICLVEVIASGALLVCKDVKNTPKTSLTALLDGCVGRD